MTPGDYAAIVGDLTSFWDSDRTRHLHHPMFAREFADSAFVVRDATLLAGYLMGFRSQTGPLGYVHLVAVRRSHRGMGIARALYEHFAASVRGHGVTGLKAITTPGNTASVEFHRALGFVDRLVADYSGPGQDRVLMECDVHTLAA